jgi:hypothetical protein
MRPGQNYDKLIDYIESCPNHAHPLQSVWLIATDKEPDTVRDEIAVFLIDNNDKLIVVDTTNRPSAWQPSGLDWLKNDQI